MSTDPITYRTLTRDDLARLGEIDRREHIEGFYHLCDGQLVLRVEPFDVGPFTDLPDRIARLQALHDAGATAYGAFDGDALVGMSVLDHTWMVGTRRRMQLAGMWVSRAHRGRGIGRRLFGMATDEAHTRGAEAMYVSATPTVHTIKFYTDLGCVLTPDVDADQFAREPEDIHLEVPLA